MAPNGLVVSVLTSVQSPHRLWPRSLLVCVGSREWSFGHPHFWSRRVPGCLPTWLTMFRLPPATTCWTSTELSKYFYYAWLNHFSPWHVKMHPELINAWSHWTILSSRHYLLLNGLVFTSLKLQCLLEGGASRTNTGPHEPRISALQSGCLAHAPIWPEDKSTGTS